MPLESIGSDLDFYLFNDVGHGGPLHLVEESDEVETDSARAARQLNGDQLVERGLDPRKMRSAAVLLSDPAWKENPTPSPFMRIVDEIVAMHNKKQKDYGTEGDPLANVRASAAFGVDAWIGCMIRANDKMKRIQKAASGGTLANESVEDSLLDLAVYSIIGLVLYRETHPA